MNSARPLTGAGMLMLLIAAPGAPEASRWVRVAVRPKGGLRNQPAATTTRERGPVRSAVKVWAEAVLKNPGPKIWPTMTGSAVESWASSTSAA